MKEVGATKAHSEKKVEKKKKIKQAFAPHLLLTTYDSHSHPPGLLGHA